MNAIVNWLHCLKKIGQSYRVMLVGCLIFLCVVDRDMCIYLSKETKICLSVCGQHYMEMNWHPSLAVGIC